MVKSATTVTKIAQEITAPHDLLTVSEVATILRVDDTTVRRWAKTGALDVVVLPHASVRQGYRVRRTTIDKMLATPAVPAAK